MPFLLAACLVVAQAPELLDRTIAIVSGHVITLSDARTVLALGLVEGGEVDADVTQRLVDRQLMLIEADRYEPPAPPVERVEARLAEVRARAGGDDALAGVLARGGFTEGRLRAWVRDDLRIAAYLQQRFVADERRADLIADWLSDLRRRAEVVILPQ
ncbi:MAG: hypothetical protein AB7Q16_05820 [Vicinamibacterales bacterium]